MHSITLDPHNKYQLKWFFDDHKQRITFNAMVETTGWVGFGISPNGGMTGSDLVIGWIDEHGRPQFHDRYAEEEELPTIDESQDWHLLESGHNGSHTWFTFTRVYYTCDTEMDLHITSDMTKIIWAYSQHKPSSPNAMPQHKAHNRGARNVHLLSIPGHRLDNTAAEHIEKWDITSSNLLIPNNSDTTYWCKIVIAPFKTKVHVIRIEPMISPKTNAPFVHHMVLYRCLHPNSSHMDQYASHSGANLRQYDADTATMGSVADYRLFIPPKQESVTIAGHCHPTCFRSKIPDDGLHVIASLPHGHKHVRKILVRHFRNGTELEPIAEENNYDFNFQDFQRSPDQCRILRDDHIVVECTYNTQNRDIPLFGGLSTKEEMCLVFIIYYPRMKLTRNCLSGLTPQTVMTLSDVAEVHSIDDNDMNPLIVMPSNYANERLSEYVQNKSFWDQNVMSASQQLIRFAPQKAQCFWRKVDGAAGMDEIDDLIQYPTILNTYKEPVKECQTLSVYKYVKPSQPIYRPPSARIATNRTESPESHSSSTTSTSQSNNESLNKSGIFGNKAIVSDPLKSALKRSKSFGANVTDSNCESIGHLMSIEDISWENMTLIRRSIEKTNSMTTNQLMQIVRIICNKAIDNSSNSRSLAIICLTINEKQSETHRHLFIESLINCLREWFNERDRLRLTSGGARRWVAYVSFICELYMNLKTRTEPQNTRQCFNDTRHFDNEYDFHTNRSNDSQTSPPVMAKQEKQFSVLLYDSFQAILMNANSTPTEIECLHSSLRSCGKYLEEDNASRMKTLMATIRDTFLSLSQSSHQINCQKLYLEIIELCSSRWHFTQSQLIYYFPYTKPDQ
ncbi:unnamed protein product [Medioppia subpectinata]|uniref:DOMON domain-containing protein n=1 Tax=Medioppia subpectinata TaxID=1979941 RepID=A0A7R9KGK8_9ACAR|nr:unnamed protein product [Medioppia subpectinata]CAG2101817.1 unnamed protein product [Medioppia subpectinata]